MRAEQWLLSHSPPPHPTPQRPRGFAKLNFNTVYRPIVMQRNYVCEVNRKKDLNREMLRFLVWRKQLQQQQKVKKKMKHQHAFSFRPTFRLLFVANEKWLVSFLQTAYELASWNWTSLQQWKWRPTNSSRWVFCFFFFKYSLNLNECHETSTVSVQLLILPAVEFTGFRKCGRILFFIYLLFIYSRHQICQMNYLNVNISHFFPMGE